MANQLPNLESANMKLCLVFLLLLCCCYSVCSKSGNSAFFIFGDSTVDPGNNNYIDTVPDFRADHEPYGLNGFFNDPTGRFSDGRVIVDFIAEYANLRIIPPFMQPSVDYSNGVNFASGGAGVLSETNQGRVIDLGMQLRNFEQVEKSLVEKLGDEGAKEIISEAVYFISIGSNDYMGGYLSNPKTQQLFNPQQFIGMVIGNLTQAIQVLYQKGGRKFGFLGVSPLGCLPALRAINPEGGCFEAANGLAQAHNYALNALLMTLQGILNDFKYSNSDFYTWFHDRILNPTKYDFKDGVNACCGSGAYGGMFTCGGTRGVEEYQVCENIKEHIWWDSFHATERIHEEFAQVLWEAPSSLVAPYNLKNLFFNHNTLTIAHIVDAPLGEDNINVFSSF